MKKTLSFEDYLKSLNKAELIKIYTVKAGGATASLQGCGQQPIGPPPTPNGYWSCIDDTWVWIPEIG